MTNKLLKKTVASAMALTFLSSAAPVSFNASKLTVPTLTASAENEENYAYSYDNTTNTAIFGGTLPEYKYYIKELFPIKDTVEHIYFQKDTVLPKDCDQLLSGFGKLKSVDFEKADFSRVESTYQMFKGCHSLETVNFTGTDFTNVTYMNEMFRECYMLTDVINLKASSDKITAVNSLFEKCYNLMTVDVNNINTKNATDFNRMFMDCHNLRSVDLRGLDTSSATNISWMFNHCVSLVSADTSKFNTSNVKTMEYMFDECDSLIKLDLSNFDTKNCKKFKGIFDHCNGLREVDISGFTISDDADVEGMFNNYVIAKIKLGPGIKKITQKMSLYSAPKGWVNEENTANVFSDFGRDKHAEFENNGYNTYIKNPNYGSINSTGVTIYQNGTFGLRIGVTLPDTLTEEEKASAYISCYSRYCGHTEENIPLKSDGKGGYYAVYRVYPKEMISIMNMMLFVNDEYIDEASLSIRQYADILFNDPETYSKEQELLKAMMLFGGAAQRKFDFHHSVISDADAGISYSKTVINSANNYSTPSDLEDLKYNGTSIILGSGIVQRHYFNLVTGDINNYTFMVDDVETTPTLKEGSTSVYYVDATKNGAIMKLYDPSTVRVYKNSEPAKTIQYNYSVMDYVRLAKNKNVEDADFDVIKTLSWMADEAKVYFKKN